VATTLTLLNLLSAATPAEPAALVAGFPDAAAAGNFSDLLLEGLLASLPQAAGTTDTKGGETSAPKEETPWTPRADDRPAGETRKGSDGSEAGNGAAPWVVLPFVQVVLPVSQPKPLEISLSPDTVSLEPAEDQAVPEAMEAVREEPLDAPLLSEAGLAALPVPVPTVPSNEVKGQSQLPVEAMPVLAAPTPAPAMVELRQTPETRETPALPETAEQPAARELAFTATLEPKRPPAPRVETPAKLPIVEPRLQPPAEPVKAEAPLPEHRVETVEGKAPAAPEAAPAVGETARPTLPEQRPVAAARPRQSEPMDAPVKEESTMTPAPVARPVASKDPQQQGHDERGAAPQGHPAERHAAPREGAQGSSFATTTAAVTPGAERTPQTGGPTAAAEPGHTTPLERIAPATAEETRTGPVKDLSLRLQPGPGAGVDLRFVERAGQVEVTVKTQNQGSAELLAIDLPALQQRLESQGFQATIRTPAQVESATPSTATSTNSHQESQSGITAISGDSAAGLDLSSSGDGAAPHQQTDLDELQDAIALRRLRKDRQDS